jgi:hypothetical protein
MKKFIMSLALLCSTSCFAFPEFNVVQCEGAVFGYLLTVEYQRDNHNLTIKIDGQQNSDTVNEEGNRIYSNPAYDEDGVLESVEIISNSSNWNAALKLYENSQLVLTIPLSCRKMSVLPSNAGSTSAARLLSKLIKG